MGKHVGGIVLLGLAVVALRGSPARAAAKAGRRGQLSGKITLRIYNYARVPTPILVSTEPVLRRILRQAGLETKWLDCRLSATDTRSPVCARPATPSDLILKLLPSSMAQAIPTSGDTVGIAIPTRDKPATDAFILYGRVLDLARTGYVREQEILAAVMAHEIGHLLLGPSHSPSGIMSGKWTRDELELTRLGRLLFTPEESALLRTALVTRAVALQLHP